MRDAYQYDKNFYALFRQQTEDLSDLYLHFNWRINERNYSKEGAT